MLHDAFTLGLLRSGAGGFGDLPTPYTVGRPNVITCFGQQCFIIMSSDHNSCQGTFLLEVSVKKHRPQKSLNNKPEPPALQAKQEKTGYVNVNQTTQRRASWRRKSAIRRNTSGNHQDKQPCAKEKRFPEKIPGTVMKSRLIHQSKRGQGVRTTLTEPSTAPLSM